MHFCLPSPLWFQAASTATSCCMMPLCSTPTAANGHKSLWKVGGCLSLASTLFLSLAINFTDGDRAAEDGFAPAGSHTPRAMHSLCTTGTNLIACGGVGVSASHDYMAALQLSPDSCGSDIRHLLAVAESKSADLANETRRLQQEAAQVLPNPTAPRTTSSRCLCL